MITNATVEFNRVRYIVGFFSDEEHNNNAGPSLTYDIAGISSWGERSQDDVLAVFDQQARDLGAQYLPEFPEAINYQVRRLYLIDATQSDPIDITEE